MKNREALDAGSSILSGDSSPWTSNVARRDQGDNHDTRQQEQLPPDLVTGDDLFSCSFSSSLLPSTSLTGVGSSSSSSSSSFSFSSSFSSSSCPGAANGEAWEPSLKLSADSSFSSLAPSNSIDNVIFIGYHPWGERYERVGWCVQGHQAVHYEGRVFGGISEWLNSMECAASSSGSSSNDSPGAVQLAAATSAAGSFGPSAEQQQQQPANPDDWWVAWSVPSSSQCPVDSKGPARDG
eukprot:GHVT01015476.1.p1 GENE.GHVT01015476.1~~GHVT01015476.1.p1  ORF type:complete len:238 (-),score=68.25 GHVT01015476.1:226-939(-)